MITISEDFTVKRTDIDKKVPTSSTQVASSKLTILAVDTKYEFGFIADRNGNIHVYDLVSDIMVAIQMI